MAGAVCIIPARYASERFPGKVLASDTGRPLIRHVWEAAGRAASVERVVVATDDARVMDACRGFGAEAVMTRADHPNGTSRLAEAAAALGLGDDRVVVNVQGDEPEVAGQVIDAATASLLASDAPMATVGAPFEPGEDPTDPNIVKVVRRLDGRALCFSRAPIPAQRPGAPAPTRLKHIGLYAYRAWFLHRFAGLAPTPAEASERLEQLRALEHGYEIAVAVERADGHGIDTPEQYAAFVRRWRAAHG